MPVDHDRVRLYSRIRSAHLERAAELPSATILYGEKRYDFQNSLTAGLDLVHTRGLGAAWFLLRHQVGVLEVNEPLMLAAARSTALALAGLSVRRLAGRPRTRVVSYAIENLDVHALPSPLTVRGRLGRRLDLTLSRLVWRRLDRIAYGTTSARDLYAEVLPAAPRLDSTTIPALPAPAEDANTTAERPLDVLFLGAFVPRKGLPQVLRSWPHVVRELPQARLRVVGKGRLQPEVEEAARSQDSVAALVDPRREVIRDLLRSSRVLVLPSQPQPGWHEQVGLPIVEGLSYGCTVVTTTETGLGGWLAEHGHQVVDPAATEERLAEAVLTALRHPLDPTEVLASLPDQDGRLAADAWLFRGPAGQPGSSRDQTIGSHA